MKEITIEVMPHKIFEECCLNDGLNDDNVEQCNTAFIDIIGTEECLRYYLKEDDTRHYFLQTHDNVMNLEFDDLTTDMLYDGHVFKTMTIFQAEVLLGFIERNIKNGNIVKFRICCRAGISRSRAVGEFIYRYCVDNGILVNYNEREEYVTSYNVHILSLLNNVYWKKYNINGYSVGMDYPEYIRNIPLVKVEKEEEK